MEYKKSVYILSHMSLTEEKLTVWKINYVRSRLWDVGLVFLHIMLIVISSRGESDDDAEAESAYFIIVRVLVPHDQRGVV